MQNPELKEYKTPSCTFFIPVNTAGEELPEMAQDEDYDEQEQFSRWMEQKEQQDLFKQQNHS